MPPRKRHYQYSLMPDMYGNLHREAEKSLRLGSSRYYHGPVDPADIPLPHEMDFMQEDKEPPPSYGTIYSTSLIILIGRRIKRRKRMKKRLRERNGQISTINASRNHRLRRYKPAFGYSKQYLLASSVAVTFKLNLVFTFLDGGTTGFKPFEFTGNSAYDFFATVGTLQPPGFAKLVGDDLLFSKCYVKGSSLKVSVTNESSYPMRVYLFPSVDTAPSNLEYQWGSQPNCAFAQIPATATHTVMNKALTRNLFGKPTYSDDAYSHSSSADPAAANKWYWRMLLACTDLNNNAAAINYHFTAEAILDCILWSPERTPPTV